MTVRLYYDDPYQTRFSAQVIESFWFDGRPAVILDRSAFYPTGGGQPHDTGRLNGIGVVDVVARDDDGAVVHILEAPLADGQVVEGEVDWARRFDLMQQHTGQHILSAAFVRHLGANTVAFHLAEDYTSIDLDRAPLSAEELSAVEALANTVVLEDRPVVSRWVSDAEVPALSLRKPLAHEGPVRTVEVVGWDCSACGGTHVRATGEVGPIKIIRSERRGAETRVEFLCGERALADYRAKHDLVTNLAREFSVGYWELPDVVHRLADELKATRREVQRLRNALLDAEADALGREAVSVGEAQVVRSYLPGRSADDVKHLAQRLASRPRTVVLLAAGGEGQKGSLVFVRSTDLGLHLGNLMRQVCQAVGGQGGGRPEWAQGGTPHGERVGEALAAAFQAVVEELRRGG